MLGNWENVGSTRSLIINYQFQCSKLLADISVIQFYPSKFVLVTDILDTFGKVFFIHLTIQCSHMIVSMQTLKVKNDHCSKFSNLSSWKEEAGKKSGL